MIRFRLLPLLFLPLLSACSDQRATFEIQGSTHTLSLIRITGMPWENTAKYSIVAAHMPACMRRHTMLEAAKKGKVEVFSPGNDAWILKQNGRLFVTETRTCEGFTKLDQAPEGGLGTLMGAFEMRNDTLLFTEAPRPATPLTQPPMTEPETVAPIAPTAPN